MARWCLQTHPHRHLVRGVDREGRGIRTGLAGRAAGHGEILAGQCMAREEEIGASGQRKPEEFVVAKWSVHR